jgi:protein-S-isoprenylcysteine O-methyltransferase Ste14
MSTELIFRILLFVLLVSFVLHRGIQTRRRGPQKQQIVKTLDTGGSEKIVGVLGVVALLSSAAYIISPSIVSWASLPFAPWLRYSGVALALTGFALLQWAQSALSSNWSDTPVKLKQHTLTVVGPYRRIRHPIYTAFLIILSTPLFLSANWLIGISWIAMTYLDVNVRINTEEAMLRETFGDEFTAYAKRSGRLLPRLGG